MGNILFCQKRSDLVLSWDLVSLQYSHNFLPVNAWSSKMTVTDLIAAAKASDFSLVDEHSSALKRHQQPRRSSIFVVRKDGEAIEKCPKATFQAQVIPVT